MPQCASPCGLSHNLTEFTHGKILVEPTAKTHTIVEFFSTNHKNNPNLFDTQLQNEWWNIQIRVSGFLTKGSKNQLGETLGKQYHYHLNMCIGRCPSAHWRHAIMTSFNLLNLTWRYVAAGWIRHLTSSAATRQSLWRTLDMLEWCNRQRTTGPDNRTVGECTSDDLPAHGRGVPRWSQVKVAIVNTGRHLTLTDTDSVNYL